MERVPALDGIRALAIVMVVAYHVDKSLVPAGHWGVIVFFVLSGYLVTRLLSSETDRTGRIDFRRFYLKRSLRLIPPLAIVCVALLSFGTGWAEAAAAAGYYANYARIGGLDLGLLTHTWFVAVMAHFYLLWPIVIAVVPSRHRLRAVAGLAVAAVAWRVIAIGIMSPGWVYNATDTNAAALLAGCCLAVARPGAWRFAGWSIPAMLALTLVPGFGDQGAALLWGGFVAIPLGVFALQYALARPSWLEWRVLVWLGQASYGLYLWHYVFVRSDIPTWIALVLSVAAAAASRYLVDEPIQRWRARRSRLAGGASEPPPRREPR